MAYSEEESIKLIEKTKRLEEENADLRRQNEEMASDLIGIQSSFVDSEIRIKRRERIFRIMQALYNDVMRQTRVEDIYDIAVRTLCARMGYERCVVLKSERDVFSPAAYAGYDNFEKYKENFTGKAFSNFFEKKDEGLVVNATNASKYETDFLSVFGAKYFILAPFGVDREYIFFIGNMGEDRIKKPRFSQSDVEVFRLLGSLIASVIKNIELYNGLEQKVAERTREISEKNILLRNEIIERAKAEKTAESALRIKTEFLTNMSHEIRTPMNAIVVMTELALSSNVEPEKIRESLMTIKSASDSLLMIINDILDFSKIEAGMLKLECTQFNLHDVLKKIYDIFYCKAFTKKIKFCVTAAHKVPAILKGDPLRLEQILVNLVSNAIKFTSEGEVSLSVSVESENISDDSAIFSFCVKDTGIGIEKNDMPNLFTSFHQIDNSVTRKYGGTGLGLAISKKLSELMNGEISIESVPGTGTSFYFKARFKTLREKNAGGTSGLDLSRAQAPCEKNSYEERLASILATGEKKVLIVEDNHINQYIILALFQDAAIPAEVASNGLEAVEAVKKNYYSAILMDIQMPIMDGYTATRLIRQSEHGRFIPIIAVTAHAMKEELDRCIEAGMNDYVTKPIDTELLFEKMGRWMSDKRVSRNANGNGGVNGRIPPDEIYIPGIDSAGAIARAGGNKDVFIRVLKNFCEDYSETSQKIRFMLAKGEFEAARNLSHSIKGVSGNISAGRLYIASRAVNEILKGADLSNMEEAMKEFETALSEVIKGINSSAIFHAGLPDKNDKEDAEDFMSAVARMDMFLKNNDFNAISYFKKFERSAGTKVSPAEISELSSKLEKLNFKGCRKILENIARKLGISIGVV
ncbi:MAG TPA: ATP-binding protein [Candidatus Wallbacteria bacterium]|nr:ATP-binding protein [Candidatus Wallbacteria bacterium]